MSSPPHQIKELTRPPKEVQRALTVEYLRKEYWIFDEIWKRIDHHIDICDRQIKRFSKWALFNRYTLPLLTAFASGLAGVLAGGNAEPPSGQQWLANISIAVAIASFLATIVSALNAAMRPALQYGHYVRYINRFWTQRIKLEIAAEEAFLTAGNDEDALQQKMHKLVAERSEQLDKIIETFSEESVSNIGIPIAEKHA